MTSVFDKQVFQNYISTHFINFSVDIQRSYQSRYYLWISYLRNLLPSDSNARILEIGSGMGHNLYALKKMGYRNIYGFDISKECVEFCTRRKFQMINYSTVSALGKTLRADQKYDLIVIYDLIEHCNPEEAKKLLFESKQLLNLKGRILISNPNGEFPFNSPVRYIDITHKFLYTGSSLSQLLALINMRIVKIKSVPSFTLRDNNMILMIIKICIIFPFSVIADGLLRLFLLSQGVKLCHSKPQLFCLAEKIT